jgi:hypothetical protein
MTDYGDECEDKIAQLREALAAAERRAAQAEAKAQRWIAAVPVDAIATVMKFTDWNEMPSDGAEADWKTVQAWLAALRGEAQP